MHLFISLTLKSFFLFTPFFALAMFLAMTEDKSAAERRVLAHRVALATAVIAGILLFCGQHILILFGITVDAFRIGAGILLLLLAISLMNQKIIATTDGDDISVVPLAMPVIIGPAAGGAILVMSAELHGALRLVGLFALLTALFVIWLILLIGTWIERKLGKRGISILMRLTALILAALSAQMIMTGVCGFLSQKG